MGDAEIPSPYTRGESVDGVVGFAGDAVKVIVGEWLGANNRAEYLFAHHLHFRPGVGENGGFDKVSAVATLLATGSHAGALIDARLDEAGNAAELLLADQRSHLGFRIEAG